MTLRKTTFLLLIWIVGTAMASTRTKAEMFSLAHDILNGSQTHRAGNTNSMKTLQQGDMLTVLAMSKKDLSLLLMIAKFLQW